MNNSLRSEIALAFHEYAHPHALMPCKHLDYEQADQILALVESKMPEKKDEIPHNRNPLWRENLGFNEAIDSVRRILKDDM